jgi:hypothetical protein
LSQSRAQDLAKRNAPRPVVFQASGPNVASIQATVDEFRFALGAFNNGNTPGPLASGRREINWDGGGSAATSLAATPFAGFLLTRGALFATPGSGFVQAPASGLAETFTNASYASAFQAFSSVRLFSPIGSNVTDVQFCRAAVSNRRRRAVLARFSPMSISRMAAVRVTSVAIAAHAR